MTTTRFQQKRGTTAQWLAKTTPLLDGEIGIDKDTGEIKVGDGTTMWADLPSILGSAYLPVLGTAHDSYRLGGQEPSFYMPASADSGFLKTADAASFLPATGQAVDSAKLGGNAPSFYLPASAAGSFLPLLGKAADSDLLDGNDSTYFAKASDISAFTKHWGDVTTFPTGAGVRVGDTCVRTDVGINGSLWTYSGGSRGISGWVHKGVLSTTSAWRPATAVCYQGLEIFETNTNRLWVYTGVQGSQVLGPWLYVTGGTAPFFVLSPMTNFYGWNDTRAGNYENLYYTYSGGEIHLRGLFGNTAAYGPAATGCVQLPSEIAPTYIALRSVFTSVGTIRIEVRPSNDATNPNQVVLQPTAQVAATSWHSVDISWPITNNRALLLP